MEAFFVELKENVEAIVFIHDFEEEYFLHYDMECNTTKLLGEKERLFC